MSIRFEELLQTCGELRLEPKTDSRKVRPGDIFVAIAGERQDGAKFIADAARAGASYIVCRQETIDAGDFALPPGCALVAHPSPREAVWRLAASRWPVLPPEIIGITGTNGKTTSAYLLEWLFTSAGYQTGVTGTVNYRWGSRTVPAPLTTPDALTLYELLAKMAADGVNCAIMEVSSHALEQGRVGGIRFSGALFSNLTQDHLDFHGNMENYFRAKASLFLEFPRQDKALAINSDDPYGRRLLELRPDAISYGLRSVIPGKRHLGGEILSQGPDGLRLKMSFGKEKWELRSPLIGSFNALNLLGAQALALGLGLEPRQMAPLEGFHGVCGRLERIKNPRNLNVFVDYAHTPDALTKALRALKDSGFQRIVTVFGCGGNRDRSKRPLMGEAVAALSDIAILTSDNPRLEDPLAIIEDVKPGLKRARQVIIDADRRSATRRAIELLEAGDALLIAGKGHEDYQIIGAEKIHYSDQEVCRELLHCE